MLKVEQVKTNLNFKSNNDNVRDAMCFYINSICIVNNIIWPSSIHQLGLS